MDGLGGGVAMVVPKMEIPVAYVVSGTVLPQKNLVNKVFLFFLFWGWEFVSLLYFYFT